ncbi:hypothetical protein D3C71_1602570 [compost metagenome]
MQRLYLLQRDVAGRHVDVKHARQNELQRAALGAHHQVNAREVALERLVELRSHQQHQRDGRQAQREHQQVEHSRQGARPEVTPRQAGEFEYS